MLRVLPCEAASGSDVPCFSPMTAYPGRPGGPKVVFAANHSYVGAREFQLPCGQCIGCRIAKARDWSTRIVHESKLHPENAFVTLTYSDEHLPSDGSLSPDATRNFLKRLRSRLDGSGHRSGSGPFRYFLVGEYGSQLWRPHYHVILFGWFPDDGKRWRRNGENYTYRSALLEEVWPYGHVETGRVTPASAGYVARYSMKKLTGEQAATHYVRPHPITGQFFRVLPEFARMSRRPGVGSGWFDRFAVDVFPSDYCIVDGRKRPMPQYYKLKLNSLGQAVIKAKRQAAAGAPERLRDSTPDRLAVRAELARLRMDALKRELE